MLRLAVCGALISMTLSGCERDAVAISQPEDQRATQSAAAPGAIGSDSLDPEGTPYPEKPVRRSAPGAALHDDLRAYVGTLVDQFDTIPEERRRELRKLALFIETKRSSGEPAKLIFICTHNSRRSHMGQLWSATAAAWYGVDGVGTFSGGTEATAFNPRAVAALERAGLEIEKPEGAGENPRYRVTYGPDGPVMEAFSKVYDDESNPQEGFAAVMTCAEADKNCPVVRGAALRVALPYVDPKEADDTPQEAERYDERARQIATEVFYLFSQV